MLGAHLAAQLELLLLHVLGDLRRALDEARHSFMSRSKNTNTGMDLKIPAVQVLVHQVRILVPE